MREPDRIIRLKTVLARTGLSRSTIYRKIAEGTFPAQLKISINGTGWHESDINRWIADPVGWSSMKSGEPCDREDDEATGFSRSLPKLNKQRSGDRCDAPSDQRQIQFTNYQRVEV
jgi:prophage regulatory protein